MPLRFLVASLALFLSLAGCGLLLDTSPPDQRPDGGAGGGGGCVVDGDCSDEIACTIDTCESGGICTNKPEDGLCEAGDVCGPGFGCTRPCQLETDCDFLDLGECVQGHCAFGDRGGFCVPLLDHAVCSDAQNCTIDACGEDGQCTNTPSDELCDDGFECTIDSCGTSGGSQDVDGCVHVPDEAVCADGIECTTEACDPLHPYAEESSGCTYVPNDELCAANAGQCTLSICVPERGCEDVVNTGATVCGIDASCNVDTGMCEPIMGTCATGCSDGDPCNGVEVCDMGTTCVAGDPVVCPAPTDPCLEARCQPLDGGGFECVERKTAACFEPVAAGI